MKALILKSNFYSFIINNDEDLLSRQLRLLTKFGIKDLYFLYNTDNIEKYKKDYDFNYTIINDFNKNLEDDVIIINGDSVFSEAILNDILELNSNSSVINTYESFSGITIDDNNILKSVDKNVLEKLFNYFPIVKINKLQNINNLDKIFESYDIKLIDNSNEICLIFDGDAKKKEYINNYFKDEKIVYLAFSTDIIHGGHIRILKRAKELGKVIVGVMSDQAVASFKRYPVLDYVHRYEIIKNIKYVDETIEQKTLSYTDNLIKIKPDYVVHGDEWRYDSLKYIREDTLKTLKKIGGKLIEYPFSTDREFSVLEFKSAEYLSIPEVRRGRLKKILSYKPVVSIIEAHNGLTGLIAEKTTVVKDGKYYQFDGMWVSSLCDSTSRGKPDIELVDLSSRLQTIDEIMEVTTKPIILDADTGGLIEHFVYNVKTLERIGVSAVIIEDKIGLKKNSLFGTEVEQHQDTIENFCNKISAGKQVLKTKDFMIIARIESLILEQGMDDALKRAFAYSEAGADGIMIHSRRKEPDEIFEFCSKFREKNEKSYLVVVPTTFNTVTEDEFADIGVNIVIYANQLTRSAFPAMKKTAETILYNRRAKEADDMCMSIKDILTLIPEE
ncbi:phosphoenolpyruvate mutase [Brachyspira alvinipulli]|uniref:phosphoenolpyruvate mutase n=1 Tax=Brachyspira alvinipulli TaxID=84379 RepID=UPI0004B89483|nr:phosphoenolpyruvate mutase [Brachyspira alvinipulli]